MFYRSTLATLGLGVCLSPTAHAQLPQTQTLQTERGAPVTAGDEAAVDEPWVLSLGVTGSYEGNLLFTGTTDGENDYSHGLVAGLTKAWKLRRGGAALGASASQSFYRDTASLNDFRYNVSGSISHMITRRLIWSGSAATSSGLARDSQLLTDSGFVLPSVTARSSSSSSTLSYALSPKTHLSWFLAQSGVGFSGLFAGGNSVSSTVSWSRSVGKSQTLGATQDYSHTFVDGADSEVYGFLGTWSLSAGNGWTAYASAGARPYSIPDEGFRVSLGVSAGVTRPLRTGQAMGIFYSRSPEQSYGVTRTNNLVQTLSGNYTATLRRNLTAAFSGTFTFAKDPRQPDRQIKGQVGQFSLTYRLLRNLDASFGTALYSRVENDERVNSGSTYVGLNYVATWR
jgi:hypothetical protein